MKRMIALGIAGALSAPGALFAAPQPANAQVGFSVGFGSDLYDDDYGPGLFGVGVGPVGYFGGYAPSYYSTTTYYVGSPGYYAEPAYPVVRRPARRVVVNYEEPDYTYAPRRVVRTRVVTRAPRYVTRIVTATPEVRRSRVVQRRVYY